jgi:hypothetical protein
VYLERGAGAVTASPQPRHHWLAEGRDTSATLDSSFSFSKNDGDNEITGTTVSNGDPRPEGILGARIPHLFKAGWRWFYTQQHGDNSTYEAVPNRRIATRPTTTERAAPRKARAMLRRALALSQAAMGCIRTPIATISSGESEASSSFETSSSKKVDAAAPQPRMNAPT